VAASTLAASARGEQTVTPIVPKAEQTIEAKKGEVNKGEAKQ
jgi:hypothetical protein